MDLKELKEKAIAGAILIAFGYVVYLESANFGPEALVSPVDTSPIAMDESRRIYEDLGGELGGVPVVMFETSWCGICRALKGELTAAGVPFLAVDVEKDGAAGRYYRTITRGRQTGVPVTLVGTEVFVGGQVKNIIAAFLAQQTKATSAQSV